MKNALDMLVNTLDMAKQIISELEKMSEEKKKHSTIKKKKVVQEQPPLASHTLVSVGQL